MIELTVSFERKPLKTYQFDKDAVLIGRDPTCDIQIDNVGISRHHARIEKKGVVYVLADLGSGNGTFVNGQRIKQHNLNDGEEIGLWNYSILFKLTGSAVQPAAAAPKVEAPKKIDMDMTIAIDGRQLDLKQRERGSAVRGFLLYNDPKHGDRTYSLIKTTTFWGADQGCDFKMDGWFVMPRHAMIVRDETGFRFVNFAKSKQGTVNGEAVADRRLKEGDIVKIGGMSYKYFAGLPTIK